MDAATAALVPTGDAATDATAAAAVATERVFDLR
jgi:hypothetical protein